MNSFYPFLLGFAWKITRFGSVVFWMVFACIFLGQSADVLGQPISPGGVSPRPVTWFKADFGPNGGVPLDGATVTTWNDQSAAGNNGFQRTPNVGHVYFQTAEFNYNPGIDMDSNSIAFLRPISDDFTIFVVYKTDESTYDPGVNQWYTDPAIIGGDTNVAPSPQRDFGLTMRDGNLRWAHDGTDVAGWTSGNVTNNNQTQMIALRRQDNIAMPAVNNTDIFESGTEAGTGALTVPTEVDLDDADSLHLGSHPFQRTHTDLNGAFAEVIFYDYFMGTADRRKIHTYLSIKYGFSKVDDSWVASDGTEVFNTDALYSQAIVGIARDDSSGLDQRQSSPSATAMGAVLFSGTPNQWGGSQPQENLSNPVALNHNQYLILGHQGGSPLMNLNFESLANARWNRHYKIENNGNVDSVTVVIPDGSGLAPANNYYAIVSTDTIFTSADQLIPLNRGTGSFNLQTSFPNGIRFLSVVEVSPGPGGVSSNLVMWYKANHAGPVGPQLADGTAITLWRDAIGTLNSQNITAGVTLETNELNFNPAVRTGGTGYIDVPGKDGMNNDIINQEFSIFTTFSTPTGQTLINDPIWYNQSSIITKDTIGNNVWGITYETNGSINFGLTNSSEANTTQNPLNDGEGRMVTVLRSPTSMSNTGTISLNGGTPVAHNNGTGINANDNSFIRLSDNSVSTGQHLENRFGEVLFYNSLLTAGEVDKIETYMAIKYGVNLPHSYYSSLDTLLYSPATSGGYNNEVIGIGSDPFSSLDQRQSRSQEDPTGLTIYNGGGFAGNFPNQNLYGGDPNPNPIQDFSFLLVGHNNLNATMDNAFGGFNNSLMPRIYRVEETDSVGDVTLLFPPGTFTDLTSVNQYSVIVSANATIDGADPTFPMDNITGTDSFYAQINFAQGTSYFSIIKESNVSPGGVDSVLTMWVRGDLGTSVATNPFVWSDFSGRGADMTTQAPFTAVPDLTNLVNFHPYVSFAGTLQDDFLSSVIVPGQAVFFVGRATTAANNNPVYMGWQGSFSLLGSNGNGNPSVDKTNVSGANFLDNTFGGELYADGSNVAVTTSLADWSVVSGIRVLNQSNGTFHLGASGAQISYPDYDFSEVIVLDTIPNLTQRRRIQSYLAIRHGISLRDTYMDSDGTVIYNPLLPSTFDNNVIAIGRDNESLLYQRQSKSENIGGIVAIGVGDIVADNATNAGNIPNDKSFLFLANDGGSVCWTAPDSLLNSLDSQFIAIDRMWKFTPVNGFAEPIDFEIDMDDLNFNIPIPLTSSSTYFLIRDDDGDFTNGGTDTLLFTGITGAVRNRTLTNADYAPGGVGAYFTVGILLYEHAYGAIEACAGDPVDFLGSFLVDTASCISLHFDDGTQSFDLYEGVAATDSTFVISSNTTSNECLDTLSWVLQSSLASLNSYAVTVETSPLPCGTGPNTPTGARVFPDSLTIGSTGSTTFSYLQDTVCVGDGNIIPTIPTPLGSPGQFYLDSTSNLQVLGNPGLLFDSTGTVYVHALSDGFHKICYTLAGDCVGETCDSVRVKPLIPLSLIVPNNQICIGSGPDTLVPNIPGGTFTSVPALLTPTFATSGAIDSQAEQAGTYQITYSNTTPGTCYQPISITIVISEPVRPVFSYPDTIICTNTLLTTIVPVIQQLPNGGGNFSYYSPGGGNLNLDVGNGEITLPSDPDIYFVSYDPTGGGCTSSDSVRIEIVDPPVITSFLLDTSYCIDNLNSVVIPAAPAGGIMEDLSGLMDSLFFNGTDWEILPRGPLGGPFPVRYTYTDPSTGCSQSQTQLTELVGVSIPTWAYDTTVYCLGSDSPPRPTLLSGQGGGTFSASIGITIDQNTGEIDTTGMTNNTQVTVFYTDTVNGCAIPVQTVTATPIRFFTAPDPIFVLGGPGVDSLCPGVDTLLFSGATGSGQYSLWLGGVQLSGLNNAGIAINDTFVPGANYEIRRIVSRNQAPGCRDSLSEFFYLNPLESAAFDYGMDSITLCSNAPDVFPAMYGDGGGMFSSATAIIDNNSGQLFLDSTYTNDSTVTSHLVTYMTAGACPDTVTTLVRILPGRVTFFEYLSSIVCNNVPQFSPDSIATTGGTFSCPNCPFGVNIDQNTGAIDVGPVLSDITLEINYAFSDSTCADTTRRFIQVEAYDTGLSIDYPLLDYCPTGSEVPVITVSDTASVGVFLPVFGVNISDPVTGEIDLGSSTPGGYLVRYRLNGECAEIATDTVTVLEPDDAEFTYPTPTVCEGTDSLMGAVLDDSSSVGTFTWNYAVDPAVLTVDPLNGQIDLGNSDPGVFWVTHTSGGQCTEVDSQRVVISSLPNIGNLQVLPSDSVCGEDTIEVRITSGGIPLFIVDSVLIPNTPILTIENPEDGQVITGIVRTTDGCADTATVTITQNIVPRGDVGTWPNTVSGDEEIEIIIQALTDETSFAWTASSSDNVSLDVVQDTTDMIDIGGDVSIVNNVELTSDYFPGTMEYVIVPFTESCRGDTIFLPIAINPNNQAIFIPGVFTPNGDTKNDTWQIQWRSDIAPEQHIIEVYNRTGGLVYTMEGLISTWDGENLPDGVYWYLVKDPVGETIMAGGLTIRRR